MPFQLRDTSGKVKATAEPGESVAGFLNRLADLDRSARLKGKNTFLLENADLDDLAAQGKARGLKATRDGKLVLEEVDFSHCFLEGAKGCFVDFGAKANFQCAVLDDADFSGARFRGVDFSGALMRGTGFDNAYLECCVFKGAAWKAKVDERPDGAKVNAESPVYADRVRFRAAKLDRCEFFRTEMPKARLEGASLQRTSLDRCNMTDASYDESTDLSQAVVHKSVLISSTVHQAKARGATMRNNSYIPAPTAANWLDNLKTMPRYLLERWDHEKQRRAQMPEEMRKDFDAGVALQVLATAGTVAMAGAAVSLASHAAAMAGTALSTTGLVSVGAVGMLFFHQHIKTGITAGLQFAGERLNAVWGALVRDSDIARSIAKVGSVLVGTGSLADKMLDEFDKVPKEEQPYLFHHQGCVITLGDQKAMDHLLKRLEILNDKGELHKRHRDSGTGVVRLIREVGADYPAEKAPYRVALHENGSTTAVWRDDGGHTLWTATYGPDGDTARIFDHMRQAWLNEPTPETAWLFEARPVFEEFKEGVVRSLVPYDSKSHVARLGDDGTIVIRDVETGNIDNGIGPAVRRPSGEVTHVRDGRRVERPGADGPGEEPARRRMAG